MAKKKVAQTKEKLTISDIAAAWKAGWTPTEVNALLDRVDSMGDLNAPEEVEDEDDDLEDMDDMDDVDDEDDNLEDEDQDESDEDEEDNDSSKSSKKSYDNKKKADDPNSLLERENKRLKKQIEKLQMKNRNKDVSGGENKKPIEKSLIDTIQSLFD